MQKMLKKMKKDVSAISPVIATLMLVLIAVAASSGFYLWQSGWQQDMQDDMGGVDITNTITIAGSSTVFEFMTPAAAAYMEQNPSYAISISNVGSGAGVVTIGQDKCDIGMASRALKASEIEAYPNLVQTTIAYDGIVMVMNDALSAELATAGVDAADYGNLTAVIAKDIYLGTIADVGDLATALNPDTGVDTSIVLLVTYDRADESGTEDGFAEMMLDDKAFFGTNTADVSVNGNQGMIDAMMTGTNMRIGFASYGMAESADVDYLGFNDVFPDAKKIVKGVMGIDGGYEASRPLVILTNGEPTGEVQTFINFILEAENNVAFCEDAGFISYTQSIY